MLGVLQIHVNTHVGQRRVVKSIIDMIEMVLVGEMMWSKALLLLVMVVMVLLLLLLERLLWIKLTLERVEVMELLLELLRQMCLWILECIVLTSMQNALGVG